MGEQWKPDRLSRAHTVKSPHKEGGQNSTRVAAETPTGSYCSSAASYEENEAQMENKKKGEKKFQEA